MNWYFVTTIDCEWGMVLHSYSKELAAERFASALYFSDKIEDHPTDVRVRELEPDELWDIPIANAERMLDRGEVERLGL